MNYDGFISTLIKRSEQLLMRGSHDDLSVTRRLLLMNTGFALVHDRIRFWDDSDRLWKKVKGARKKKLKNSVTVDGQEFFEQFRTCEDWDYFKIETKDSSGKLTAHNVGRVLKGEEPRPRDEITLDSVWRALRNSFAHGGILPMSWGQADEIGIETEKRQTGCRDEIDRVYFVSKWTSEDNKQLGWKIIEFGLPALDAFWHDWCELLLASEQLDQLDQAA